MSFEPVRLVYVYYQPEGEKILVGRLAIKARNIFFEYEESFLKLGLDISPFTLPLQKGVISSKDSTFNGLFGVFNDSLPDGWGRLLLDRNLISQQVNPHHLSPLDRLCFVGAHGMGALSYEPDTGVTKSISNVELDKVADEVRLFQENDDDCFVEDLLILGGSSAGARPKVLLSLNNEDWIVKFRSSVDPKDIGSIEYAYYLMAKEAGLELPEAKLFPSKSGQGFFGTKRFDKVQDKSIHMHTISGLLHADHQLPSLDYEMIMKAVMHLTHDMRECEKLFRQCVFNVLSHNRDDHAKNFSLLMSSHGQWRLSPAYDLTFSSGPGGEHCSMVMGEGKNPGLDQLLKLAQIASIKAKRALEIIDEVKLAVSNWHLFADEAQVGHHSKKMIATTIKRLTNLT